MLAALKKGGVNVEELKSCDTEITENISGF